jgi:hypothetical protein
MSTTLLNWQSDVVIKPSIGAAGAWSADITVLPDPCMFGRWMINDSVGATFGAAINTQMGATYDAALTALMAGAERWRLAYMGVTIYQDGPTLSDQGTVVAAQVPCEPTTHSFSASALSGGVVNTDAGMKAIIFQNSDLPDFQTLVRMPNAYFSQSKHGCYMPIKLSTSHQAWHSTRDCVYDGTGWAVNAGATGVLPAYIVPGGPTFAQYPYGHNAPGVVSPQMSVSLQGALNTDIAGTAAIRCFPCNENWGHVCFTNMSVATRLVAYFRVGFEVQALPSSVFSPYLKLSPPFDPLSIDAYYRISRELKDAYPADYNDLGKLWEVIKGVARTALPLVAGFGPLGKAASVVGSMLLGPTSDGIKQTIPQASVTVPENRDKPPAAAVERAQALRVRRQPPPLPPRGKPKKRPPPQRRRR